jgi:FkbM family methyltransferase
MYRGTADRIKWFADRLLRRSSRLFPVHPVANVRLREMSEPVSVRLGTSDWVVLEEIFRWGAYDALFAQTLGQVRTIVDLGANVGLSVRLWQKRFPDARIIAVEPEPRNVQMLRRNVTAGPRPQDVTIVPACVAGSPRSVGLDASGGAWGVKMRDDAKSGVQVPAMTMPQILAAGDFTSIDLLKCDIEGAEAEVFADCSGWIGKVRWLAIELHPPYTKTQCLADLQRSGGRFVVRHEQDWVGQEVLILEQPAEVR